MEKASLVLLKNSGVYNWPRVDWHYYFRCAEDSRGDALFEMNRELHAEHVLAPFGKGRFGIMNGDMNLNSLSAFNEGLYFEREFEASAYLQARIEAGLSRRGKCFVYEIM